MTTEDEKREYIEEHLRYEELMLRYTLSKVTDLTAGLDWCAYLESFAVHARNIHDFLTNNEGSSHRARDFVKGHRSDPNTRPGSYQRLNAQIFHLTKGRPSESSEKFNSNNAMEVAKWIDAELKKFFDALGEDYLTKWRKPGAKLTINIGGSVPTATNTPAVF